MNEQNNPRGSTFAFRKRWGQIDWRSLAAVDVDRIARETDFQALQENIMNITFCNIESEEFRNVDVNFVKLFRLAQLIIEYLLHSQQYLSEQSTAVEQRLQELQQDVEAARSELTERDGQLRAVKKENRKRRRVIEDYQHMMSAGATGLHPCPVCQREFVSAEYLQSHILRRHPDHLSKQQADNTKQGGGVSGEELEGRLLERMTERLQHTEQQLRQEIARKEEEGKVDQARQLEEWKRQEQLKMERELEAFREPVLAELREVRQEKAQLEHALKKKQEELDSVHRKKQSNLGQLEGAQELDLRGAEKLAKKNAAEAAKVKQQFEAQVEELQAALRKQDKTWQRRMSKLSSAHQEQLKESAERQSFLEQSLQSSKAGGGGGGGGGGKHSHQVEQQLSQLKKKVSRQEQQLLTQQHQLTVLHSRETSPVHSMSAAPPSTMPPPQRTDPSEDDFTETSEDEEEEEEMEEEVDGGEGGGESSFTPFPARPAITTRFEHGTEVLESVKKETQGILRDALLQRGLDKNATGLSCSQLEGKLRVLEQERNQRMKLHYNFSEHRDRLARLVDSIAAASCVFDPQDLPQRKTGSSDGGGRGRAGKKLNVSLPVGTRSSGKPPKPTSAKLSSSQPVPGGAVAVVSTPPASPVRQAAAAAAGGRGPREKQAAHTRPALRVTAAESESSDGLSESEEEEESGGSSLTPSPPPPATTSLALSTAPPPANSAAVLAVHRTVAPASEQQFPGKLAAQPGGGGRGGGGMEGLDIPTVPVVFKEEQKKEEEEDSPWDSESDSIEELAAPPASRRASSTPIKVSALSNSLKLTAHPSQRPVGGVPVFPQAALPTTAQNDSDDSFDITDTTAPAPTAKQSVGADALNNNKPFSRTTTSRSALTTVSFDDFDSDLSDLEITD